jgi:hypothetical protein
VAERKEILPRDALEAELPSSFDGQTLENIHRNHGKETIFATRPSRQPLKPTLHADLLTRGIAERCGQPAPELPSCMSKFWKIVIVVVLIFLLSIIANNWLPWMSAN